jgi:hypothetical protein
MYKYIKSKSDNTISDFGGHDMANGLRLHWSSDSINNFVKYFNMYLLENDIKYTDSIEAEMIDNREIDKKVSWIEQHRPFGNSNPYPVVEIEDLEILKITRYSKMTLMTLTNGIDTFKALYFDKQSINDYSPITVKGTLEIDNGVTIIINEFVQHERGDGIEISSYSKSTLGRMLTNVHYNKRGKSLFDIEMTGLRHPSSVMIPGTQSSYFPKFGLSVEAWYKANNSFATTGKIDDIFDFNLMVRLIQVKLTTYNLLPKITNDVLHYSTHNVGKGRWSSRGDNMFMEALRSAFLHEIHNTKTVKTKYGYVRVYEDSMRILDIGYHMSLHEQLEKMFNKYKCVSCKGGRHKAIAIGDIEYKYTGAIHKPQQLDHVDKGMFNNILNRSSELMGKPYDYYNHILINRFDNCGIGAHTDDEEIYRDTDGNVGSVMIISVGDTLVPHMIDGMEFKANNGSVIEMSTGKLKHSVGSSDGIRYSITFRHIPHY